MRKIVIVVLLLFHIPALSAQEMSDEYERMFGEEEAFGETAADSLWPSSYSGGGSSLFGRLSRYNFNFISYRNRGNDRRNFRHYLENLDVSAVTDRYPDYSFYNALRVSVPNMEEFPGCTDVAGGGFGTALYGADPSRVRRGISLRADYSEIHYRGGVRLSAAGDPGKGWTLGLKARYRGGRDKFIGGVFSESWIASAAARKDFGRGGKLVLFGMGAVSERGMRNWTVGEAFRLTGDNLYNPSWGWLSGSVRNSNVRNDANGLFAAAYSFRAGVTDIKLSAMYRGSERSRSRIVWQDAMSPMPDHYANLPGYYSDPQLAAELAYVWMTDPGIRQIDWDGIYDVNRNSVNGSVYMLGEEVSRTDGFQAAVSAASRFSETFVLLYGLRFSRDKNTFFRRAGDMLGGEFYRGGDVWPDAAMISRGDRFGYDFQVPRTSAAAYVSGAVEKGRWSARFTAELTCASLFRKEVNSANYIPEAGTLSGPEHIGFTTYDIRIGGDYRFSVSHKLSAALWAGSREPSYQDIFLDPQLHDSLVEGISCMSAAGAEVKYAGAVSQRMTLELSAYYTRIAGETEVYRYYDNAAGEYVIMPLSGISKRFAGVEAAVKAEITGHLSVTAGVSVNEYVYVREATADFYSSASMKLLAEDDPCDMEGLVCSPSPQAVFALSATYTIPYTWSFSASFAYGGYRYVAINPAYRTDRISGLASSPETARAFMSQERLSAASSLDMSVSRRFRLRRCYAYVGVTVRNLLGSRNMIYGGYEQMRVESNGTGPNRTYSPSPSRYAYCYPRSVFATVSINF